MSIFGLGMAILGGTYALVVAAVTADKGSKSHSKPSSLCPSDSESTTTTDDKGDSSDS